MVASEVFRLALCAASMSGPMTAPPMVLRVPANDRLTPVNLAILKERSPTAREMIARIEALPLTSVQVRARPYLTREAGVPGRARLWVAGGRLHGLVEYQAEPTGNLAAVRVLAHELAHVLEIGVLVDRGRTRAAMTVTFACASALSDDVVARGGETEFATSIGRHVHRELTGRAMGQSALEMLALAGRLQLAAARPGS